MISFNRWWERESGLNVCSTFERMKMSRDKVGNLKF
jgi:hypothetical protein